MRFNAGSSAIPIPEHLMRGPRRYTHGAFSYDNLVEGDIARFSGREHIRYADTLVYSHGVSRWRDRVLTTVRPILTARHSAHSARALSIGKRRRQSRRVALFQAARSSSG